MEIDRSPRSDISRNYAELAKANGWQRRAHHGALASAARDRERHSGHAGRQARVARAHHDACEDVLDLTEQCPNCSAQLVGEYCHDCGQRRLGGRLTVRAFVEDVARRVFRFDKAVVATFWQMLRSPGTVVVDYIEGRRRGLLDPIQYFISTVFVQFVLAAFVRFVAPLLYRDSAIGWLAQLGGVVALKILVIFWMASIWRLLFGQRRYNLAEIYVFATYVFGTTGLLLATLPVANLAVPIPLGNNPLAVSAVTIAIEIAYTSYAVSQFAPMPMWQSVLRVGTVLVLGYGVVIAAVGIERTFELLQPRLAAG